MILRNVTRGMLLAGCAAATVAFLAGCGGGGSSNLPTSGTNLPIVYGRQTSGAGQGQEVSGLGSNPANTTSTNPSATDIGYLTFSSQSTGSPLGSSGQAGYVGLAPN